MNTSSLPIVPLTVIGLVLVLLLFLGISAIAEWWGNRGKIKDEPFNPNDADVHFYILTHTDGSEKYTRGFGYQTVPQLLGKTPPYLYKGDEYIVEVFDAQGKISQTIANVRAIRRA